MQDRIDIDKLSREFRLSRKEIGELVAALYKEEFPDGTCTILKTKLYALGNRVYRRLELSQRASPPPVKPRLEEKVVEKITFDKNGVDIQELLRRYKALRGIEKGLAEYIGEGMEIQAAAKRLKLSVAAAKVARANLFYYALQPNSLYFVERRCDYIRVVYLMDKGKIEAANTLLKELTT